MLGGIYGLFGLIVGFFITMFSFIGAAAAGGKLGMFGILFGIGAIIFIPLFYGIIGMVVGIVMGIIYNLGAKKFGGIKMDLKLN